MRLHQFAFSHFNEKARWALAWKGLAVPRSTYLPGPHMGALKNLSGQTQTPVLQDDDRVIVGSSAIIDWLEQRHPLPALYPEDVQQRDAALALQADLDEGFGPAVRRLVFAVLVEELGYLSRMFGSQTSTAKRFGYRALLPLVKPMMVKGNGLSAPEVQQAREDVRETLNRLSQRLEERDFLVGSEFSVADLTAAALFAPLLRIDHPDMARPQPAPAAFQSLVDEYADHPVAVWAHGIYARYRACGVHH